MSVLVIAVLGVEVFASAYECFTSLAMHAGPIGVPQSPNEACNNSPTGVINQQVRGPIDHVQKMKENMYDSTHPASQGK